MCMHIMEASRTHDHKVKITVVLATVGLAQAHPNKQLAQFELKKKTAVFVNFTIMALS